MKLKKSLENVFSMLKNFRLQSINLDQIGLNIDGYPMQALQTNSSGRTFSCNGESHQNYSNGKLSFFLDPVSLLPCVAGAWQDHSGEQTICHGMIPPDANSPHKREPLFDSDWWDVLLKYSLNTDKDGYFFGIIGLKHVLRIVS